MTDSAASSDKESDGPKTSLADIIVRLEQMADMLEIVGTNPFKIRAFFNAARALESLPGDLEEMIESGKLLDIPGIGKGLFKHIKQTLETGTFDEFEELRESVPSGLLEIMRVSGMGPKKVKAVYEKLEVTNVIELEKAANEDRISGLPGFGKKTQENILRGIRNLRKYGDRYYLNVALKEGRALFAEVAAHPDVQRSHLGGSLRRVKETIKDIDILVSADKSDAIMDMFTSLPLVEKVVVKGHTKSSIMLKTGINADLRVVNDAEFPFAQHYFTGSKQHNTEMRGRAKKMGYKLNEYGLFKGEEPTPCKDEHELFTRLGLDYIEPELREAWGEIDAAENHTLPTLVAEGDIKGLFHVHTDYSDGTASVEEMAQAAQAMGFEYLGITDHSKSAGYAGGLTPARVKKQAEEIAALNESMKGFRIFHGIESDILAKGTLDYPDDILAQFDFIIASIHGIFTLSERAMTQRIIKAIENPYTTMLGHPTGRLLLARDGYKLDLNAIIDACADSNVAIEINSHPHRLDLDWRHTRIAKERGVKIAVCPDAHTVRGMEDFRYGVGVARKGWLEKKDLLNTYTTNEIETYFRSRQKG
jgi:DNA polymerase (family 10)